MDSVRGMGRWAHEGHLGQTRGTIYRLVALSVALTLLCSAYAAGYWQGNGPVPEQNAKLHEASVQIANLQSSVHALRRQLTRCVADGSDTSRVRDLISRGEYNVAAALANDILSGVHLPCDVQPLAALYYTASLDALLSTPVLSPLDETPVLTWQSIEHRASTLGLAPPHRESPLNVFARSYTAGIWQLAAAAFVVALRDGLVSAGDSVALTKYVATLRNEGHALAFHFTGSARARGIRFLATCAAISRSAGLLSGECAADLTELLGAHQGATVPPDQSDPVLAAIGKVRGR